MGERLILILCTLFGQFLLVLTPGLVRAIIQLPSFGISARELFPIPILLLLASALSYGFFFMARQARQSLLMAKENEDKQLQSLKLKSGGIAWPYFSERMFLLNTDLFLLAIRLLLLVFFMLIENYVIAISALLSLGIFIWLRLSVRDEQIEKIEFTKLITFQALPILPAFYFLFFSQFSTVYIASLFLFNGLLWELIGPLEQALSRWRALPLSAQDRISFQNFHAAWVRLKNLPFTKLALFTDSFYAQNFTLPEIKAELRVAESGKPMDESHFEWKNGRLEILLCYRQ